MAETTAGTLAVEKISEYIEALATQLGVAAEHVYAIMTRQMFVEGVAYGLLSLIAIIVIPIVLFKGWRVVYRNWDETYHDYSDAVVTVIVSVISIVMIFVFIINVTTLPESVMKMMNPEYYVIREILSIFGK